MPHDYDVTIIGAGMVGASLACALAPSGLRIAVIEAVSLSNEQQPSYDDRGITLSPSSRIILEHLGIWQQVIGYATPIKKIHVSEQGRFGFTQITTHEAGYTDLGHVVIARSLGQALHNKMEEHENIKLLCPFSLKQFKRTESGMHIELSGSQTKQIINTALLVGADGSQSLVRRLAGINTDVLDFKQSAIVSNITTQKPNHATAYERFTEHGPIALLPIDQNRSVLVFTVKRNDLEIYLAKSDQDYIQCIEKEFGRRLGNIIQLGKRRSYPIHYTKAVDQYQDRLVLLGNAAHTLHPNAAQGFNLGLRDVAGLSETISIAIEQGSTLDDINILKSYYKSRKTDQDRVIRLTNGLAKSFYNRLPLLSLTRDMAMLTIDNISGLKRTFTHYAMGVAGRQPAIIRGLPI